MPTHAQKKFLPYSAAQLYALVAEVEKYPQFLPWCLAARINKRTKNADGPNTHGYDELEAELVIGYKALRERFISRVQLYPHTRINVQYHDGPFKYLNNHWLFEPAKQDGKAGCMIDFYVDFAFRNPLLQSMIQAIFSKAVAKMVSAFELRAQELYR